MFRACSEGQPCSESDDDLARRVPSPHDLVRLRDLRPRVSERMARGSEQVDTAVRLVRGRAAREGERIRARENKPAAGAGRRGGRVGARSLLLPWRERARLVHWQLVSDLEPDLAARKERRDLAELGAAGPAGDQVPSRPRARGRRRLVPRIGRGDGSGVLDVRDGGAWAQQVLGGELEHVPAHHVDEQVELGRGVRRVASSQELDAAGVVNRLRRGRSPVAVEACCTKSSPMHSTYFPLQMRAACTR